MAPQPGCIDIAPFFPVASRFALATGWYVAQALLPARGAKRRPVEAPSRNLRVAFGDAQAEVPAPHGASTLWHPSGMRRP